MIHDDWKTCIFGDGVSCDLRTLLDLNEMNEIKVAPRIYVNFDDKRPYKIHISQDLLSLNNFWAAPIFQYPGFRILYNTETPFKEPVIVQCTNEFNLSEEDKTVLVDKIDGKTVLQFMSRSVLSPEDKFNFVFNPLSSVFMPPVNSKDCFFNVADSLPTSNTLYFEFSIGEVSVGDKHNQLSDFYGVLFLFNKKYMRYASELSYVSRTCNTTIFTQTKNDKAIFKIRDNPSDLLLVFILMHPRAITLEPFISALIDSRNIPSTLNTLPVPFAFSCVNPFSSEVLTFPTNWIKTNTSDALKLIGIQPTPETPIVNINATIHAKTYTRDQLQEHCYLFDENRDHPMVHLSIPQLSFDTSAAIILNNFQFHFGSALKCELVQFKMFYCESVTDPMKPNGLKVFSTKTTEISSFLFESNVIMTGKLVVFPDIIRIPVNQLPSQAAHIIIHVISHAKGVATLSYVTALSLYDNGYITTGNYTCYLSSPQNLKASDYLIKLKNTSKYYVTVNIDLAPSLFLPKPILDFSKAKIPEQINWSSIMQLPYEVLQVHFIPIALKLISLVSKQTLAYLLELINILDDNVVKPQLRSWLYHNYDGQTIELNKFLPQITELISNEDVFVNCFDMISDIVMASHLTQYKIAIRDTPFFTAVSDLICKRVSNSKPSHILNREYSRLLFLLRSNSKENFEKTIVDHIRNLLLIEDQVIESLTLIFEFLMPLTKSSVFLAYCAIGLPVKQLSNIMFSPYLPILSTIFLATRKALMQNDENLNNVCTDFYCKLFIPAEDFEQTSTKYRIGYAMFPLLDIISNEFEANLNNEQQFAVLPAILFLITYVPSKLLQNYFQSINTNFQYQFINFLSACARSCISQLDPTTCTHKNGIFDQLTQRIINFLMMNFKFLLDSLESVIRLLSLLSSTPFQTPRNFPRLFDCLFLIISHFPTDRERSLITFLVNMIPSKQHISRAFATSLIIFFFKTDYEERNSVIVSSAEFVDALTSTLLYSPMENLVLYRRLLSLIQEYIPRFKIEILTMKLADKIEASVNILDFIEKLRSSNYTPDERIMASMQIADQSRNFPSMRMKWLQEIVRINLESGSFPSAFVAQLHVCALVATVVAHEASFKSTPAIELNLLICQPLLTSRTYRFSNRDFSFFPSVLIETLIDFDSISEDFQFISSDFTIDLLKNSIHEAVDYGLKAKMFYDVRCLNSLLLRIAASEKQFEDLSTISGSMKDVFLNITALNSVYHDNNLIFYVKKNRIYCVDDENNVDGIIVDRFDKDSGQMEHLHCWSIFRSRVTVNELDSVSTADSKEIPMIQYTTKEALPRFVRYSEIIDEKAIKISLIDYARMEVDKLDRLMIQTSIEFEKCFPFRPLSAITGKYRQNLTHDMERFDAILNFMFVEMFEILKLIDSKDNALGVAVELANKLRAEIQRMIKIYLTTVEYTKNPEHLKKFQNSLKNFKDFVSHFKLKEVDQSPFEGRRDPLSDHMEYDEYT